MLRAVIDANVYVSAFLRPEGAPGQVIERFLREGVFDIVLSPAIVVETLRALAYPKVRKYARTKIDSALWFEDIVVLSHLIGDEFDIPPASKDRDDDKYLAAAIEGRADCVVSGDADLLILESHQRVRIVTPRAFLKLL